MDKKENNNIEKFYQSAEISASIASDYIKEKKYTEAARMLWEAYRFSGKSEYLEKIAILYGFIDGAEEEGINLIADLYMNHLGLNISKKALIFNALHLKLKSQFVNEDASFGFEEDSFEDVLDAIEDHLGFKIVDDRKESFYIYDKNTAYINDIKERVHLALENFDEKSYLEIQNEILALKDFEDYEELLSNVIYIGLTYNFDKFIVPLVEKLLEINSSSQFGIFSAITICNELKMNPFNFNIDMLATNLANKMIEKKSYNQLGLLLINMPYDLCKNAVLVALVALSKVEDLSLRTLYAVAAQYMNVGNLNLASKYIEIGQTIYPRSLFFLYLNWYKKNYYSLKNLDSLHNIEHISNILLKELFHEIDLYDKEHSKKERDDNGSENSSTHFLDKWRFQEKISILLFLAQIQDINVLFDSLVDYGDRKSYFNFLTKEISSAYHELPVRMSIFTAIQYINKDFQKKVFIISNKSVFSGIISTQVFPKDNPDYKRLKKTYVDIATNLFFINLPIKRGLIKKIILKFENIIKFKEYNYSDCIAAMLTIYYEKIKTDSDIDFIYRALRANIPKVKELIKNYKTLYDE
ncbi:MAG TPA: hypothetical protein GX709_00455 [Clostridiales bacterium]|nr:hypothetical protein [Clostridiales bacterium]